MQIVQIALSLGLILIFYEVHPSAKSYTICTFYTLYIMTSLVFNLLKILSYIFIKIHTLKSEGWTGYFIFYLYFDSSIISSYYVTSCFISHQLYRPIIQTVYADVQSMRDRMYTSPVNHVLYDDVPVSLVFLIFLEEILQNIICIDRQLLCNQQFKHFNAYLLCVQEFEICKCICIMLVKLGECGSVKN